MRQNIPSGKQMSEVTEGDSNDEGCVVRTNGNQSGGEQGSLCLRYPEWAQQHKQEV